MVHERELVVALADAGRAAEVVDREGRVAAFREPEAELLVEGVEPAYVRKDDDTDTPSLDRPREEGSEPIAVTGLEHEVVVRDRRTRDGRYRRPGVWLVAHAGTILPARRGAP